MNNLTHICARWSMNTAANALRCGVLVALCVTASAPPARGAGGQYNNPADFIPPREPRERLAANTRTIAATGERVPNAALIMYKRHSEFFYELNHVVRLVPGIVKDREKIWSVAATNVNVEDAPGSVIATCVLAGVTLVTEFIPLGTASDTGTWEGAALYKVTTAPPTPVRVRIGAGNGIFSAHSQWPAVFAGATALPLPGLTLTRGVARFLSSNDQLHICAKSAGVLSTNKAGVLRATFAGGAGYVMFSAATTPARAATLIAAPAAREEHKIRARYAALLRSTLDTPVPALNQAFRTAIYHLEYVWMPPYGWLECLHHWPAFWHMQAGAGADWLGQRRRARLCAATHADNLMPNGAIPQFYPDGTIHDHFGGTTHYWAWQLRHYLDFTGDTNFARYCTAAFDSNLVFVARERDHDGDLLLQWKQQIGNQEDFIATPYNGTTPTVEGIAMLRTRALLADLAGDTNTALRCRASVDVMRQSLRDTLWMPDLGRFAYYRDPYGKRFLDGPYHTYTQPTIYGILDEFDSYTNLRHLRDRFTGAGGEVYCANMFPTHHIGTTGAQAGTAQQPWAAWALAAQGLNNETYRPLKAAADWVMDANHRGAWPEVSIETPSTYFTPPAGLFIAAVAEALFGLRVDRFANTLTIAPSLPDAWPHAALTLPGYAATYQHSATTFCYTVRTQQPIAYRIAWSFPPSKITRVLLNGTPAAFTIEAGVGRVIVHAAAPAARQLTITVVTAPVAHHALHPKSLAEGAAFNVRVPGCRIVAVDDRCRMLAQQHIAADGSLRATVNTGLLQPYRRFGTLGQLNFSKRTFFVQCQAATGVTFWLPIDLLILPPVEAAAGTLTNNISWRLPLAMRNNTSTPLYDTCWLTLGRHYAPVPVALAPRAETNVLVALPDTFARRLSPGDNQLGLLVPHHGRVALVARLEPATASALTQLALPPDQMMPDSSWASLRGVHTHNNIYYFGAYALAVPPLNGMAGVTNLALPGLPGLSANLVERKFIPVSGNAGKPAFQLSLPPGRYKKLYLVVLPLLDFHDIYSDVAVITLRDTDDKIVCTKTLALPGDLDWWWPPTATFWQYATAQRTRTTRRGWLPLRASTDADWPEGIPPHFPNYAEWSDTRALVLPNCVVNLIEITVPRVATLKSLTVQTVGADPAFGILAVLADKL